MKLSLRDRLNTVQKTPKSVKVQQEQPKYYVNDKEAKTDSLGVVDSLLIDDDINSIFVSGASDIYIEKKGKTYKSTTTYRDNIQLVGIIKKLAQIENIELDNLNPVFELNYKKGINIVATLPPLSNVPTMFIKIYKDNLATLNNFEDNLVVSKEMAMIIEALCSTTKNILVVGTKSTFKTSFLSACAKKIPLNDKTIIVDAHNEITFNSQNCTTFNFSNIDSLDVTNKLLYSITSSKPDKLVVNTNFESLFMQVMNNIQEQNRGLMMSIEAKNATCAIDKIARILLENNFAISFEEAKTIALTTFDIIIVVGIDKNGNRKVSFISQINLLNKDNFIEDIFIYDEALNTHKSCGIVPEVFRNSEKTLPINDNIFDSSYKHTYSKPNNMNQFSKSNVNMEILKKFKKDLNSTDDNINKSDNDDVVKKAQEKFEALKKNAQMQSELDDISQEPIKENELIDIQNENL